MDDRKVSLVVARLESLEIQRGHLLIRKPVLWHMSLLLQHISSLLFRMEKGICGSKVNLHVLNCEEMSL